MESAEADRNVSRPKGNYELTISGTSRRTPDQGHSWPGFDRVCITSRIRGRGSGRDLPHDDCPEHQFDFFKDHVDVIASLGER